MKSIYLKLWQGKDGAVAPLAAVCMVTVLLAAALAIDLGHLYVVKAELQNAADAGAIAGSQALFMPQYVRSPGLNTNGYAMAREPFLVPLEPPTARLTLHRVGQAAAVFGFRQVADAGDQGPISRAVYRVPADPGNGLMGTPDLRNLLRFAAVTFGPATALTHCDYSRAASMETVRANYADGSLLDIAGGDVQMGTWDFNQANQSWSFTETACNNSLNAVRVTTRKSSSLNSPVTLIFGGFIGKRTMDLSGQATAMLGWVKGIGAGKGTFPLALGDSYTPPPGGRLLVNFNPNTSDTGCWQAFDQTSVSAAWLKGLVNGTTPSPAIKCDDIINLTNGVDSSVMEETLKRFQHYQSLRQDWVIILPVIKSCSNYVQQQKVMGFCAFEVTAVDKQANTITGYSLGGYIVPGTESGGPNYGLRASLPKKVQ